MGYLTGKIDANTTFDPKTDLRSGFDRFSSTNIAANRPLVDLLKHVAQQKDATPVQVAMAWLLAQKPWIVPIPGTRNPAHFQENLQALNLRLTPADLQGIDQAFAKLTVHGGRMNAMQMGFVDHSE